jgi:putative membrane protein
MHDALFELYPWIKALHIIAVITLMAGLLYLPRLFVYHCEAQAGTPESERFKIMEARLLRIIINPSLIAVWVLGLTLLVLSGVHHELWMQVKFVLVLGLSALHGVFSKWRKDFAADRPRKSPRVYRMANEIPAVLMIVIVILVVVKPF